MECGAVATRPGAGRGGNRDRRGATVGRESGHDIGRRCARPIKCRDAAHSISRCAARRSAGPAATAGAITVETQPVGGRASSAHGTRKPRRAIAHQRASTPAPAAIYAATDFTRCYPAAPDAHPAIPYTHAEFATRDGNPSADTLPMQETS
ncbi:hypothetical protein I35_6659 [Burkholderia cenocepacia H111]|nr:hypothetical protein I35_6659 [Burkholderia cenocepacia H111]